ncbi:uncharacterized protein klhdc7a isoform X1 [Hypanus sabinus]|uniref:uncharacterized protein klhdc7a isoform X1 n=1 Tax=Hypanus sabinus TaxID=79690 RepID=UPI0028C42280|nr:uncharacterized protein klhdc7a isoform X1 [Hypanus sabinus]
MEFAGKAIVSAALVVTLTLIYKYYKARSANATRRRNADCQGSSESPEQSNADARPSSQRLSRREGGSDPTRQDGESERSPEKAGVKTGSPNNAAGARCADRKSLRIAGERNGGSGTVGSNRQPGEPGATRGHLAESRGKDLAPNTATVATCEACEVRNFQAKESNKLNSTQGSGTEKVESKSDGTVQIAGEEDYLNGISPQTCAEQGLDAYCIGESQLGQNISSFDVVSADRDSENITLSANVTESFQDLIISPTSEVAKSSQYQPVNRQPTELLENETPERLNSNRQSARRAGEHENNSSACKKSPEIKIQRSNTPCVQSVYQVKYEKAQTGNGSEGGLSILLPCMEVNHKIISTSEMTTEANEYQDRNHTCSIAQITTDQVPLDNLNSSSFQKEMRDQQEVYCSLSSIQDDMDLAVKPKAFCSLLSGLGPDEHPETASISSCSSESDINIRAISRKHSISAIADTPAFLIDLQTDTQVSSEESTSGHFNSKAPSVDDLSTSSLGSLVDSLYLSQPDLSKETAVEIVAGANFIPIPLSNESSVDVMKWRLDLGNCYEILCVAKKHDLKDLQDAAYQVMSDNYLQVLKNPSIYGQLKAAERELILSRRMDGKRYLMVVNVDVQNNIWTNRRVQQNTDGQNIARLLKPFQTNHKVYYYKNENDSWHPLVDLEVESISKDCALCTMYNYLFVVAGCQGSGKRIKLSNKVFCYNPVTNIWSEISPLNQARPNCKLVALDGHLYAIGGECLSTMEKYDPRTDRWTFTAPLPRGIFAVTHKATVCNGEIYVSRGITYYQLLKYNPKENSWNDCSMMSRKDKMTDIAAVKNFIYRFEINQDYGISVFRYHIITKTSDECATKKVCKMAPFQCAVVDDTIYCINKRFMMQFIAHEISPYFKVEDCTVPPGAKGILFPFVLTLPERNTLQTRV